jgi:ENT domain
VETADCDMLRASGVDLCLALDSKISLIGGENESQLHILEKSAYTAVLRAFCAQSNSLSWVH